MKSREVEKHTTDKLIYHLPIKSWPADERPREKLLKKGAGNLSDAELLAILIRTGKKGQTAIDLALKLINEGRTIRDVCLMSVEEIKQFGIGESKAIAIVAAFELAKRLPEVDNKNFININSPQDIVQNFGSRFKYLKQEEFWVFPLNSNNKLLIPKQISKGILNSSLVHPRECFRESIIQSAAAVIFLHNHPSGNPEPSQEDIAITKQLVEAGKIVGITVHDHIIIGGNNYTSFAEKQLI